MDSDYVYDLFILVLFVGILSLPWFLRRAKALRARSWPIVLGQVESAWISLEQIGQSRFFKGKLAYSYSVEGQKYTGTAERNFGGKEDKARAWSARYPHGLPLKIRYSPKNLASSVFDERDPPQVP